jgi:succinate dehydrogenase / fumarate reductase flavoprotein subunit
VPGRCDPAFDEAEEGAAARVRRLLDVGGRRTVDDFHRELGRILWEYCGMSRTDEGLTKARGLIQDLRAAFWQDVTVPGSAPSFNQSLEKAGRVADFLELGELMCRDALARDESCGCHFREEHQTEEGEAQRDDARFCHVAVWEYAGDDRSPLRHEEALEYETVHLATRSYK